MLIINYLKKPSSGKIFRISVMDQDVGQTGKMPSPDIVSELCQRWRETFSPYGKMRNPYLHNDISPESFEEACVQKLVGNQAVNAMMHRLISLAKYRDVTISCVADSLGGWYAKILARVCARTAKDLTVSGV